MSTVEELLAGLQPWQRSIVLEAREFLEKHPNGRVFVFQPRMHGRRAVDEALNALRRWLDDPAYRIEPD